MSLAYARRDGVRVALWRCDGCGRVLERRRPGRPHGWGFALLDGRRFRTICLPCQHAKSEHELRRGHVS